MNYKSKEMKYLSWIEYGLMVKVEQLMLLKVTKRVTFKSTLMESVRFFFLHQIKNRLLSTFYTISANASFIMKGIVGSRTEFG